ncbi:hypothetical protein HaLaN_33043, partial [Haematococcus lacustris]
MHTPCDVSNPTQKESGHKNVRLGLCGIVQGVQFRLFRAGVQVVQGLCSVSSGLCSGGSGCGSGCSVLWFRAFRLWFRVFRAVVQVVQAVVQGVQ